MKQPWLAKAMEDIAEGDKLYVFWDDDLKGYRARKSTEIVYGYAETSCKKNEWVGVKTNW
jgi:hypothetical protein